MKYFIDTHDKTKGSFPAQELTEEQSSNSTRFRRPPRRFASSVTPRM
jgi:hypothetical protein